MLWMTPAAVILGLVLWVLSGELEGRARATCEALAIVWLVAGGMSLALFIAGTRAIWTS